VTYLHVRGTLDDAWRYLPSPGWETDAAPAPPARPDDRFRLRGVDREGRPLVEAVPDGMPTTAVLRGALPLHPDATVLQVLRGDVLLHEARIAADPPRPPEGASVEAGEERVRVSWQGDAEQYAVVAESEAGARWRLAGGLAQPGLEFEPGELPFTGRVLILVEAGDGVRSAGTEAGVVRRDPMPATPHVLAPAAGVELPFGQPVSLLGVWLDVTAERRPADSLHWLLDRRLVGEGPVAALDAVPPGRYRLTLAAADGSAEVSQELVVAEPSAQFREWLDVFAGGQPEVR
jgi:hypothetical protein